MKQIALAVLLFLGITTFGCSTVHASELSPTVATVSGSLVDYDLPYPGILPDHPLYFLKRFRDRLLDFLIKDPFKRIEYHLLMADKRYAMAETLTEKENYELALEITQEAEEFYGRIIQEMTVAKDQGRTISSDQIDRVLTAGQKHQEIIELLLEDSPDTTDKSYEELNKKIGENMKNIDGLRN